MKSNQNTILILCLLLVCTGLYSLAGISNNSEMDIDTRKTISGDSDNLLYTIYFIGDIKDPLEDNQNLVLLNNHISHKGKNSAVVVLGDILYPLGLPDSTEKGYSEANKALIHILKTFDNYEGALYFIPGNHDWERGRKNGLERIKNQEIFIENYLQRGNTYIPDEGYPGPVEVDLTDDITMIAFDSQWWFHKYEKSGYDTKKESEDAADLYTQIEDAIRRNKDKKIIIATHHPLYSVGAHGGYFPAHVNLFPLIEKIDWLYVPLPGFIYTGYRKYLGNIQDLAHPEYKEYINKLEEILHKYPNTIFAAGHEHNLQYLESKKLHHIVSGGGGEGTYVANKSNKSDFAASEIGFAKVSFYSNGDVWLKFISPDNSETGKVLFSKKLFNKKIYNPEKQEVMLDSINFSGQTIQVKISDLYNKGKFHRFMMGDNYRDIWNTTVELPVFDIGHEKEGLNIIKKGGGQQTRSLRLEDKNGKQYVLRSVNKFVEKALDKSMLKTIAVDAVQDGISASHPFAAVTVPNIADAAGVMHTNPKIVWVPDDPRLGIYREEIANGVFLFEERPAGNRKDVESFGRSKDIINTAKVIEKTEDQHNHIVDQKAVVRARLLDILLNDWDRHDDQWRWATFKDDKKNIYRPIPRDRDQVYFLNEGVVMWLISRDWLIPKFQGFNDTINNIKGLGFNARYFDRSFMTEPNKEDWRTIAGELQNNITDSVIHSAIMSLPDNIYQMTGKDIENKLRSRRDQLLEYSEDFYRILAKNVDVVGTNEEDLFTIKRKNNGDTEVTVTALSKKKGKKKNQLYFREFKKDETKEIRLYGLKGKDSFKLEGKGQKGIKVRIIPGKGKDEVIDQSHVNGLSKKTIVYEKKEKNNSYQTSGETRLKLSKDKAVDDYNRKLYKYNKTMPLLSAGYNIDDGVFLGSGVSIHKYHFRDSSFHKIQGKVAFQTGAFDIQYDGLISSAIQPFDLAIKANFSAPRSVDNFYGLGNETKKITDDKKYHRVRYKYAWFNPMLKGHVGNHMDYSFGPLYQYYNVTDTTDRFIGSIHPELLESSAYKTHHYTGINAKYTIDTRNNKTLPQRGIYWETEAQGFYSIKENGENFIKLQSDISFYLSFRKDPRAVFAFRIGGASNFGDYQFFHANFLGRKTNLRGFRSHRFAGDHTLYQNTELRLKLTDINAYLFNGQAGILIFNDIGKVWLNGEKSDKWHNGNGAGLWISPFDFTALTLTYSRSNEDNLIDFAFNYLF